MMGQVVRFSAAVVAVTMALLTDVGAVAGQVAPRPMGNARGDPATSTIDPFVTDAALRFAIPEHWIRVVLQAESAGDPRAVSHAGAMGLMQIMPGTWRELRRQHRLGADPFDPRDNILAGAAYLRAMADRFGSPGFLAAYNAGPEQYAEHRATGRPLPRETRAYLAKLAPLLDGPVEDAAPPIAPTLVADWRAAPIFVLRGVRRQGDGPGSNAGSTFSKVWAFDPRVDHPATPITTDAEPPDGLPPSSAPAGPQ